jgi:hypothetical protein
MITGWLAKLVIAIALFGIIAFEAGSPLITRAQVDGTAHDAADDAAAEWFQRKDEDAARAIAEEIAEKEGTTLEDFELDPATGTVRVTMFKQARSIIMKKFSQTRSWYEIRVTAEGSGPGGR